MQILEQLACGYDMNVCNTDVLYECSALLGYLECVNEQSSYYGTMESVVMEGIDPKAFLKKIWAIIKGILTKIGQMINKLISFLRGRKNKLKQKKVDEPKSDDSKNSDDGGEDISSDDSDDKNNSSKTTKAKSKDEMIEDIFKTHPYTGINPEAINSSFNDVSYFVNTILNNGIILAGATVSYANRIISADFSSEEGRERFNNHFKFDMESGLNYAIKFQDDSQAFIDSMIDGLTARGQVILKGKLSSPQDFKKVPMIFYENYRNTSNKDYSNNVFKRSEFNVIVEKYNSAIDANSKFSEYISKELKNKHELISDYVKKCDVVTKSLDKIPVFDQDYLMKAFSAINNTLNMTSQFVTYTSMGISEFCSRIDSDLDKLEKYIDTVTGALNAIN